MVDSTAARSNGLHSILGFSFLMRWYVRLDASMRAGAGTVLPAGLTWQAVDSTYRWVQDAPSQTDQCYAFLPGYTFYPCKHAQKVMSQGSRHNDRARSLWVVAVLLLCGRIVQMIGLLDLFNKKNCCRREAGSVSRARTHALRTLLGPPVTLIIRHAVSSKPESMFSAMTAICLDMHAFSRRTHAAPLLPHPNFRCFCGRLRPSNACTWSLHTNHVHAPE